MSRLNLEAFKAQADQSKTQELESLSGGILGACHQPEVTHVSSYCHWTLAQWLYDLVH